MISKKIKILISGALVCVLVISSPFKNVKAIVGVDDAILFTVIGLGAVTSIGAIYGMEKSGIFEKTGQVLGDSLQTIGNGWKTIEDGKAIAKSTLTHLDDIVNCLNSLEGTTYLEYADTTLDSDGYNVIYIPLKSNFSFSVPNSRMIIKWGGGNFSSEQSLDITPTNSEFRTYYTYDSSYSRDHQYLTNDGNFSISFSRNSGAIWSNQAYFKYKLINGVTTPVKIPTENVIPSVHDVANEPTSISLDKSFVDNVATTYAEQNPEDNNGDKNVDYSTLIPLFFSMLEERLGDGTITPGDLSNSGVSSYVYADGSVQGQNPYNFKDLVDSNINVQQNVVVNNGSEVTEEERNGIFNLIDGGFRATSERFENLNESFAGFKNTISGIFSFFPQDVQNVLFLSIILMSIFFILGLRR